MQEASRRSKQPSTSIASLHPSISTMASPAEETHIQAPAAAEKEQAPQNGKKEIEQQPSNGVGGGEGCSRDTAHMFFGRGGSYNSSTSHDRGDLIASWSVDSGGRPVPLTHTWHPSQSQQIMPMGYPAQHQFHIPAHAQYYRATSIDSYHPEAALPITYHPTDFQGHLSSHPSIPARPELMMSSQGYYQETAQRAPRYSATDPVEVHRPTPQTPSLGVTHSLQQQQPTAVIYHDNKPVIQMTQRADVMDKGKGCTCRKTQCLKLYCFCFSASMVCNPRLCICDGCKNTTVEAARGDEGAVAKARSGVLQRNRNAFHGKFSQGMVRESHHSVVPPAFNSSSVFLHGGTVTYPPGADIRMQPLPVHPQQRRQEYEFKSLDRPQRFSASPPSCLAKSESASPSHDSVAAAINVNNGNADSNKPEVENVNDSIDDDVATKNSSKEESESIKNTVDADNAAAVVSHPVNTDDESPKNPTSEEKFVEEDAPPAPENPTEPAMDDEPSVKSKSESDADAPVGADESSASGPACVNESRPVIPVQQPPNGHSIVSAFMPPMLRDIGGYFRASPHSLTEGSSWETRPRLESIERGFFQHGESYYQDFYHRTSLNHEQRSYSHPQTVIVSSLPPYREMARRHVLNRVGCKCRKSACLKKYCECYSNGSKCCQSCKCEGCRNQPGEVQEKQWSSSSGLKNIVSVEVEERPLSVTHAFSIMSNDEETVKSKERNLSFLANIATSALDTMDATSVKKRKADEMESKSQARSDPSTPSDTNAFSHHWDPAKKPAVDDQAATSKGARPVSEKNVPPMKTLYSETGGLPISLTFRKICSQCGRQRAEHGEFGFGNKCCFSTCGRCGADSKLHEENGESMGVSCNLAEKLNDNKLRISSTDYGIVLEELSKRAKAQIMQKEQREMQQREMRHKEIEMLQNQQRFIANQRDVYHREIYPSDLP